MKKKQIKKRIITFLLCLSLSLCSLVSASAQQTTVDNTQEALQLINEKTGLEMQKSTLDPEYYEKEISKIEKRLKKIGAIELSQNEVNSFYRNAATTSDVSIISETLASDGVEINANSDEPPCPPSTDKIQFFFLRTTIERKTVYSLIANPKENADHSCNTITPPSNFKTVMDTLLDTFHLVVDKAIGVIESMTWVPYEVFTDLIFNGTNPNQLSMYQAIMATRTVHQFIYLQNDAGQWVYYGSSNCVHINVEEIARKYVNGVLKSQVHNSYDLITAPNYYDWATVSTRGNLTGYGVTPKYSLLTKARITVNNNDVLVSSIVSAHTPIEVVY